ncbi:glycosyltransferase [Paenibacillus paeoniae]|uniref:Glycosyltransferase n=1 Tax=Paenibacillus paeoniae TaxID=2292705 RepID=A0A371NZK0_9BACL|nr:glycosyltransferase [Paenibacillus paeoniae]REK69099.1 glycosyltransferase [Paenibacillus paeoniae]
MKPAISVIIPTYNRLVGLKYTLESLVKQELDKDSYEVLVCDDGSAEDTYSIVKEYENDLNISYQYQEDKGFRAAAARNMGIRKATGDVCVFIDNGIVLHKNSLNEHIRIHNESSCPCAVVGYVYGFDVFESNEDEIKKVVENNTFENAIDILGEKGIGDVREKFYKEFSDDIDQMPAPFVLFWTCHVSMSRKALIDVGMFDESFTTWGGEDIDMGLALQKYAAKFVLARNATSIHYPHKKEFDFANESDKADRHVDEKKEYLYRKYPTRAVYLWTQTNDDVELNKILIDEAATINHQQ